MANELYSKDQPRPSWLLWSMTEKICREDVFLPPIFFWGVAEEDAKRGTDASRVFVRMVTNILLYLSACDDDVNYAEAQYITEVADKLAAICDGSGVKKAKEGLNPLDFVTSGEESFTEKHAGDAASPAQAASAPDSSAAQDRRDRRRRSPTWTSFWLSWTDWWVWTT
jgi:hypothetical protein